MESKNTDLTKNELTQWIMDRFNVQPTIPERETQQISLEGWLKNDENFDIKNIKVKELDGGLDGYGIVLENVLTRRECQKIIEAIENIGFGSLGMSSTGQAFRGNRRLQIHDTSNDLGLEIWRRISKFVPLTETLPDEEGSFEFLEINPRYRFAKYFAGDAFGIHVDKPTVFGKENCSIYTVNIYLNDLEPEQGGRTRFFKKMMDKTPYLFAGGEAASVAIFKQSCAKFTPVHDGEIVKSGLKYLMRTDVVYKNLK